MKKLTFILILIGCLSAKINALTPVYTDITYNQTWNLMGSPYIIMNNITVFSGVTLTISSGVDVLFQGTSLTVHGTLVVNGSYPPSPYDCSTYYNYSRDIRFLPDIANYYFNWYGIIIDYTGNTQDYTDMERCEIKGVLNNPAIQINNVGSGTTYVNVICCEIHDNNSNVNGGGIYCGSSTSVYLTKNYIHDNTTNANGGAIYVDYAVYGSVTINYNKIYNNYSAGYGGGIDVYNSYVYIENNDIELNKCPISGAGIYINSEFNVDIENNYIAYNNFNNNAGTNYGGGVYIGYSDYLTISLSNNIIYENWATTGGGLYATNSDVMISSNEIAYNTTSQNGGGCYIYNNTDIIEYNNIHDNLSGAIGGGLYVISDNPMSWTLAIYSNQITGNISYSNAGGMYYQGDLTWINNNTISGNTSYQNGGGLYVDQYSYWIENNNINTNNAVNGGGIFYQNIASGASPLIRLNYISKNTSTSNGGGLYISSSYSNITVNIINNLFDNNNNNGTTSTGVGGGIYLDIPGNAGLNVNNNTIADNKAFSDGAGIYSTQTFLSNNPFHFDNNILWGNTINGGSPNSANYNLSDYPANDYPSFQYCDIEGLSYNYNGNIGANPLTDNPLFETPGSDYRLAGISHIPPSPCIDYGDNNASPQTVYDLDGEPRISYGGIKWPPNIDMGAYENLNGMNPQYAVSINDQSKKEYENFTVYPNPFNISTNINFSLTENNEVKIEIYDIQGKSINIITDKYYTKGNYNIKWYNNLSKGVYICKMTINSNKTFYNKLIIE